MCSGHTTKHENVSFSEEIQIWQDGVNERIVCRIFFSTVLERGFFTTQNEYKSTTHNSLIYTS